MRYEAVPEGERRMLNCEPTVIVNPRKAEDILGWVPKHVGFLKEIGIYYQSWKHREQE